MILTNCAACAAPLAHDAPRCVRCETRYCSSTCWRTHWYRGHEHICEEIHHGGNAEQYHADKKYKEAVAAAGEACADDTKGQKCYICLEAVHARTGEGLVRGCGCGDRDGVSSPELGVAHVSCLAEQAKILVEEALKNRMRDKVAKEFLRWDTCSLCGQEYHGVVQCALGWACWRTYLGQPEERKGRQVAMNLLGNGLSAAGHHEDALSVKKADLSMLQRLGANEASILTIQGSLATTYQNLGRFKEALRLRRDVYSGSVRIFGKEHTNTLGEVYSLSNLFIALKRFRKARSLLRKMLPVARRVLGEGHEITLRATNMYAQLIFKTTQHPLFGGAPLDDYREAVKMLEDAEQIARRVLGNAHPTVHEIKRSLDESRAALRVRSLLGPLALAFMVAVFALVWWREYS